jgi:hypothetical protein
MKGTVTAVPVEHSNAAPEERAPEGETAKFAGHSKDKKLTEWRLGGRKWREMK